MLVKNNYNECLTNVACSIQNYILKSQHAGYSEDEIYIPLIIIDRCKNNRFEK